MKKSHLIATIATIVGVGMALTSCSSGATPSSSPTPHGVVQLSFWSGFTGGNAAGFAAMISTFNKAHPDIQVTMDPQPWDTIAQKLPTALASDSGPDIATPDFNQSTILQYAENKLALPLTQVYGSKSGEISKKVIPSSVYDSSMYKGKIYSAPATLTTLMLYYNPKLLQAAGISGPPKTMTALQQDSVKLTANGVYGIALPDHDSIANWPILVWADGGDIVKGGCSALDSKATVNSLKSWTQLIQTKKITEVGMSGQDATNLFSGGKAAFVINGPNAAGQFDKAGVDYKLAPIPVGSSGKAVTLASTIPMIVSANTKHPIEAQQFITWWLSKSAQKELALQTQAGPVRTDLADDADLKSNALLQSFAATVSSGRLLLPTEKQFTQINTNIFLPAIQAAERGADVKSSLSSASQQINSLTGCKQ
jgi:multiple sugar transport system substrate-binding protein